MKLKSVIPLTVAYWWMALVIVGGALIIHGDCPTGRHSIEACTSEKRMIAGIGFAVATLGYIAALYLRRLGRGRRPKA